MGQTPTASAVQKRLFEKWRGTPGEHSASYRSAQRIDTPPHPWLRLVRFLSPAFLESMDTEVLTRNILYELKTDTSLAFEPDGLRCTIRFPELVGGVAET
jgi:hypothetical protein